MQEEKKYKNREVDEFINALQEQLDRIEEQVKTTNHRVTKLEIWKAYIYGGMTITTVLLLPILFIIIKSFL